MSDLVSLFRREILMVKATKILNDHCVPRPCAPLAERIEWVLKCLPARVQRALWAEIDDLCSLMESDMSLADLAQYEPSSPGCRDLDALDDDARAWDL